jgi:sulfur relay (sulfurtransferase) DsrF/TusC family protein
VERRLTFILSASPYSGQAAATALKLAAAALDAGHRATIFATADGVYGFVKDQKATAVFDVGGAVEAFLARGGAVDL